MMTISEVAPEKNQSQSVSEYTKDPYCLEILMFLGKHPRTQFSQMTIFRSLGIRRFYIEEAIKQLINRGVVTKSVENDVTFYSLAMSEPLYGLVSDMVKLEWCQWQSLLRHSYSSSGNT